jgi:Zn-dependent M16 (insulinase) family peptidase
MMFDSIFDETRLKAGIAKILADIPEEKRSGNSMMYAVDSMIHSDKDSNILARGTLVKAVYMKRLKKLLAENPSTVIGWLEALRKSLFTFEGMRTLVITDIEKLPNPVAAWKPLIAGLDTNKELLPLVKGKDRLSPHGKKPGDYGAVIVPMPTIDSSFLLSTAKGPENYNDPSLPALMVAISFLDSVEGPIWTAIRGTGLAYGANFRKDIDAGHVSFSIYRSPDVHRAFNAGKKILQEYIDGTAKFEDHALEGAVSQIVCNLADEQATMSRAGQFHFVNSVVKEVDDEYDTNMLKRVRAVKVDEIKKVMKEILLPLFTAGEANLVATVAPIMEEVCLLSDYFLLTFPGSF